MTLQDDHDRPYLKLKSGRSLPVYLEHVFEDREISHAVASEEQYWLWSKRRPGYERYCVHRNYELLDFDAVQKAAKYPDEYRKKWLNRFRWWP